MLLLVLLLCLPLLTSSKYHRFQHAPRNTQCHCVLAHLCSDEDVAVNGHGLLDPRTDHPKCPNPKEICCESPQKPVEPETVPESKKDFRCGYSTAKIKTRIMSGSATEFGELPWNLIVQENGGDKQNIFKCGASLIHSRVALTAAHCVSPFLESPEKLVVTAGEWDINRNDEPIPPQDNYVDEILIYYDYNAMSLKNDIAMLILSDDFELRDNVALICLAVPQEKVIENECVASGWGQDAQKKGRYSSVLKKVQVPIVSRDYCLETLRTTRLGTRYRLHKSFICAGGRKNRDSCKGDGGSPLICPLLEDRERFVQVGIVSWGIGCGNEGIPGVYVNVGVYLKWIEVEMMQRDLDPAVFKV